MQRWKWPIAAALAALAITAGGIWLAYQSYKPLRIVGPSMAETLLGKHGELDCEKCQHTFRFDLEETPLPSRLICPNCGHVHTGSAAVRVLPGDLVRLERRELQRYDVVAFEIPGEKDKLGVKRIIGLPGETVSIKDGDVYIDGVPRRGGWNWEVVTRDLSPRWQADELATNWWLVPEKWTALDEIDFYVPGDALPGFHFVQSVNDQPQWQWIEYHHRTTHDTPASGASGIVDNDAYNQGLARQLNDVCDIQATFQIEFDQPFAIRIHDGWRYWRLEVSKRSAMLYDETTTAAGQTPVVTQQYEVADHELPGVRPSFSVSILDGHLRLKCNFDDILDHVLTPGEGPRVALPVPVAIGARRGKVHLSEAIIHRDIYYLDPVGLPQPWSMQRPLGPAEYFVLGDNVPVSTDSRHFGPVPRKAIRGVVQLLKRKN